MKLRFFFFLLIVLPLVLEAQELPPITRYATDDYRAGNQNWMLSQDRNRFIYAANNEGLLEYNGTGWLLYPTADGSIIRSVLALEDRIYTGSYMDFGYWVRTKEGLLQYESLAQKIKESIIEDEQIWDIISYQDVLIFQSLNQFFLYDLISEQIEIIRPPNGIAKVFLFQDEVYFSDQTNALYRLTAKKPEAIIAPGMLQSPIIHIWQSEDVFWLQTSQAGTYRLTETGVEKSPMYAYLNNKRVYSAISRKEGGQVFGTVSNGLFVADKDGKLEYWVNQIKGLTNNTILSLFEDERNDIWAGTDNGISCINLSSPLRKFSDHTGQLGTVHASVVYDGKLYLGSNQGLFVEDPSSEGSFSVVPGTRGQVWSLYKHQGDLFCGHDDGTYLIKGRKAQLISNSPGTWTFSAIPERPELLLQGNYSGLSVLEKLNGFWHLRNTIAGFDYSSRFVVLLPGAEVYVSHEYRGTYGLKLDNDFRQVREVKEYIQPPKGKNGGLAFFRGTAYHYSQMGFYALENFQTGFKPVEEFNQQLLPNEYISGSMSLVEDQLWFLTKKGISFFREDGLRQTPKRQFFPVNHELVNAKSGYENFTLIGTGNLLIGTADGYLTLSPISLKGYEHKLFMRNVSGKFQQDSIVLLPTNGSTRIPHSIRTLDFTLTVPEYNKYFHPRYQFRLSGHQEKWADWSEENKISFSQLRYGDYTFEARSKIGDQLSENTLSYSFTIIRPWYASYLALSLYLISGLLLIYFLNKAIRLYYHKQAQDWQNATKQAEAIRLQDAELKLTKVKNDYLQRDIESKNREAAVATMHLVKQNELLQQIKQRLVAKTDRDKNILAVIKTIDKTLDNDENWNLFREAFENADRDFFKKIKELHPELTPNDLKVCAYLRLNLTTKEIASLLNISGRSVEVKRYRLRKKIGLDRNEGLVEYIISL